jgi:hypothetical protein
MVTSVRQAGKTTPRSRKRHRRSSRTHSRSRRCRRPSRSSRSRTSHSSTARTTRDRLPRNRRRLGPRPRRQHSRGPTSTAASGSENTSSLSQNVGNRNNGTQGISIPRVRLTRSLQGYICSKRARADSLNSATHPGEFAEAAPRRVEQSSDAPKRGPLPRQDRTTVPLATRQRLARQGCCLPRPSRQVPRDAQFRSRNETRSRTRRWSP